MSQRTAKNLYWVSVFSVSVLVLITSSIGKSIEKEFQNDTFQHNLRKIRGRILKLPLTGPQLARFHDLVLAQ